ncbi:MAG: response regulator [Candidatus Omnitrophica bacterium]|nr:response regulator [Candidatus Omnitrophota bacterium]
MAQERILVVDGDIALSEMLKTRLEDRGYLVDCVRSGNEALDILKTKWLDLIILAIVLQGGMSGFRLFKEIKGKKKFSKIPIVIQSSKAAMKKTFETIGVQAYFIKPYSTELFLDKIKDILNKE